MPGLKGREPSPIRRLCARAIGQAARVFPAGKVWAGLTFRKPTPETRICDPLTRTGLQAGGLSTEDGRNRTCYTLIQSQLLYQMSYIMMDKEGLEPSPNGIPRRSTSELHTLSDFLYRGPGIRGSAQPPAPGEAKTPPARVRSIWKREVAHNWLSESDQAQHRPFDAASAMRCE